MFFPHKNLIIKYISNVLKYFFLSKDRQHKMRVYTCIKMMQPAVVQEHITMLRSKNINNDGWISD